MRIFLKLQLKLLAGGIVGIAACSSDPAPPVAGPIIPDSGFVRRDGGPSDSGRPDTGPVVFSLCKEAFIGFEGTVGPSDVQFSDTFLGPTPGGTANPRHWPYSVGSGGVMRASAGQALSKGRTSTATALYELPVDFGGEWLCSDDATIERTNDQLIVRTSSLARLGRCANATEVAGSLEGCVGISAGVECRVLTSSITGAPYDDDRYPYTAIVTGGNAPRRFFSIEIAGGEGAIEYDEVSQSGLMILPASGAFDPGAVYCIGAATFTEGANQTRFTLGRFRRLGSCREATPIAGNLDVCVQRGR